MLLTGRVKVAPNGYRRSVSPSAEELDFCTLCEVLRFVGAAAGSIQAERRGQAGGKLLLPAAPLRR